MGAVVGPRLKNLSRSQWGSTTTPRNRTNRRHRRRRGLRGRPTPCPASRAVRGSPRERSRLASEQCGMDRRSRTSWATTRPVKSSPPIEKYPSAQRFGTDAAIPRLLCRSGPAGDSGSAEPTIPSPGLFENPGFRIGYIGKLIRCRGGGSKRDFNLLLPLRALLEEQVSVARHSDCSSVDPRCPRR